jgi:O-methyltransferase involved in polyketide biosynthesis
MNSEVSAPENDHEKETLLVPLYSEALESQKVNPILRKEK